jgi:cell division protein FtsZ
MQGEIRVTVIATGFDKAMQPTLVTPAQSLAATPPMPGKSSPVIPFPANRGSRVSTSGSTTGRTTGEQQRPSRANPIDKATQDLSDMEIPTFIRRQMD